jgi:hypothetical protein
VLVSLVIIDVLLAMPSTRLTSRVLKVSDTAATREQVEDEDDDCQDEKDVNQSAADVKGETKKPENE